MANPFEKFRIVRKDGVDRNTYLQAINLIDEAKSESLGSPLVSLEVLAEIIGTLLGIGGVTTVNWGSVLGSIANQQDLVDALLLKADLVLGKIPASQLPSYVDDVVEYPTYALLPAIGETGKIYVVTATNKTYRWSGSSYIEITQVGPTGPQGVQGVQGVQGAQGVQGIQGYSSYEIAVQQGFVGSQSAWLASLVGPQGVQGVQGIQGIQGYSAYEVALHNGFVGSETTWLASLIGAQGPQGIQGAQGPVGATGVQGPQGIQGTAGVTGATGATGANGVDGITWYSGNTAPSNAVGVNGDFYFNTLSADIYKKIAGVFTLQINIQGAQGIQGLPGNTNVFIQDNDPALSTSYLWFQTNVGGNPANFTMWLNVP
jgi:hypothetical protein